ncbi:MAG: GNAT family N-acetyltransferase [Spirochaetes bacterium]|nr:GNAT family N-acetyltransferase [Spirochaetota bacterium]
MEVGTMRRKRAAKLIARHAPDIDGTQIRIRELRPNDHKNLIRMYAHFYPKHVAFGLPPNQRTLRRRWIENLEHGRLNVIALSGRRIVGHSSIIDVPNEDFCEFIFFVHQDFRGRGIGTVLAGEICRRALCLGKKRIWLMIESANDDAVTALYRIGFRISGVHGGDYEMELDLEPVAAILCM